MASTIVTIGTFAGVAVMTTDLIPWLATDPRGVLLWRASLRWSGAALIAAAIVFLIGRAANTDPLRLAGDALFVAAAVLIARRGGSS